MAGSRASEGTESAETGCARTTTRVATDGKIRVTRSAMAGKPGMHEHVGSPSAEPVLTVASRTTDGCSEVASFVLSASVRKCRALRSSAPSLAAAGDEADVVEGYPS